MSDETAAARLRLSVIIPAYNEAERIGPTIRRVAEFLRSQDYTFEVILVDDGCADETVALAREAWGQREGLRVISQTPNQGKGAAIRRGMLEAAGQWRLFSDADNSTPIEEMDKLWPWTEGEVAFDVVIGSRALRDSQLAQRQPMYRELMGRAFNLLVRTLALGGVADTQCGFKLFSAPAAEAVFSRQRLNGWAFDVEILMLARALGFEIKEIPIRWINSPATRVSALSDSLVMFGELLRLRSMYGRNGRRLSQRR